MTSANAIDMTSTEAGSSPGIGRGQRSTMCM